MEQYPFQGLRISGILQDMSIVGTRQMHCRRSHGFIIKLRGTTEYCAGDQVWRLKEGQILFVPKGSSYLIREVDPGYSYIVNFACDCSADIFRLPIPSGLDITQPSEKIYHSWRKGNPYTATAELYRLLDKASGQVYVSPTEKQLLEPVVEYLQQHLTDPELDVSTLASLSGVSEVYLRQVFKKQHGVSPSGFVIRQRLQLAKQLLKENYSVAQVSEAVGYRDPLYFSRLFKKKLGLSPTEYRSTHREDLF
jgi:AraC-like DNA-binding protein